MTASQNITGNLTVGHNVTVGGTMKVNGKFVLTTADLAAIMPPIPHTFSTVALKGQKTFVVANTLTTGYPTYVSRNGLIEVPVTHYTITGNVLTFSSPCLGGEMVYAYWNNP